MQVSAFYRGVIYISTQLAKLPCYVKDAKNNILYDAKITYLMNLQPNPEMTSFFFKLVMIQQALIEGNSFAEIQRNLSGEPIALWYIPTRNVQILRTTSGKLVYKILNGLGRGEDSYIFPEDMIHFKNFHTKDGIVGQGVVAYATNTLGITLGADQMAGGLFANGGLPSGVLTADGSLSEETFKRLKEDWKANYGQKKSGSIAILEEGLKFAPMSIAPDVLQFLESRKFSVLEIARFLGVPPTKLFDMDGAKYANMENANLEVATDCHDVWARMIEQEVDVKLLRGQFGGRHFEIDLYSLFRGDMTTRSNYFSKMMGTAAMSPNEIREKEGMPAYEGGSRYFLAVNNYSPMDRVDELLDAQIAKGSDPKNTGTPSPKTPTPKGELNELEQAAIDFLKKG
jgi:HK97 family phage portal protein